MLIFYDVHAPLSKIYSEATQMDRGASVIAHDSCTIASLCMDVFKTKFLSEDWCVLIQKGEE